MGHRKKYESYIADLHNKHQQCITGPLRKIPETLQDVSEGVFRHFERCLESDMNTVETFSVSFIPAKSEGMIFIDWDHYVTSTHQTKVMQAGRKLNSIFTFDAYTRNRNDGLSFDFKYQFPEKWEKVILENNEHKVFSILAEKSYIHTYLVRSNSLTFPIQSRIMPL